MEYKATYITMKTAGNYLMQQAGWEGRREGEKGDARLCFQIPG